MKETKDIIWSFFEKTSQRVTREQEARLKDPVTNQLRIKVAERLGLSNDTSYEDLVRHLKLMSESERKNALRGIIK